MPREEAGFPVRYAFTSSYISSQTLDVWQRSRILHECLLPSYSSSVARSPFSFRRRYSGCVSRKRSG